MDVELNLKEVKSALEKSTKILEKIKIEEVTCNNLLQ